MKKTKKEKREKLRKENKVSMTREDENEERR